MPRFFVALLRGAVAGSVATGAMSAPMLVAGRAGLMGRQPPEAIVRRAGQLAGAEPQGSTADALAALSHVAYGVTAGAAYALLPTSSRPVARGVVFGLAIYGVSYAGWVPVLRALPFASEDRPDRQAAMAVAHVVFGAVLGALDARWRR